MKKFRLQNNLLLGTGPIFDQIGPVLVCFWGFFSVFARGLANTFFALLTLWGLLQVAWALKTGTSPAPPLPKLCLWGFLIYTLTIAMASLTSGEVGLSFAYLALILYLLSALPLTWLALAKNPKLASLLPLCFGAGLIVCGLMTFWQANCSLACIRAKASLGVIELAAVLGQLPPIMVGALALALHFGHKKKAVFFLAALVASYAALRTNCSRIALLVAPSLSLLTYWVHRRLFSRFQNLLMVGLLLLGVAGFFQSPEIADRFEAMTQAEENPSNARRFKAWRQGWVVFKAHPVLGVGPRAVPTSVPEEGGLYGHTHHIFLNVLAESGVVGLFGFMALHLAPLSLIWPRRNDPDPTVRFWCWAALTTALQLLLNGMTDQVFSLKPLMYIYWSVTAMALWSVRSDQDKSGHE